MTTENQQKAQKALFFICLMAYTSAYLSRDTFSAVMPNILSTTEITKTQLGTVSTVFLIFYGSGQIVSGILGDKFEAHKLISIGLFVSAIVNFLFGFVNTMFPMVVLWGINGMALSLLWAPILKTMTVYMDDSYRQKSIVNISVSMPIGTLLAFIISAFLVKVSSFRVAFHFDGIVIMCVFLVWICVTRKILPNLPKQDMNIQSEKVETSQIKLSHLFIASGMIFITGAVMFNGVVRNGVSIWVPTYLTENFALEEFVSILTSTFIPIINLGGIYVAAFINRKTKNEMVSSAILFAVSATSLVLLILIGDFSPFTAILFLGITTSSMQGLNAIVMSFVPMQFRKTGKVSTITGYLNSSAYLASSVGSFVVGIISTNYGWDMTIMCWIATSFAGVFICLIAMRRWKKFVVSQEDN